MKLNLGSGNRTRLKGYTNIDIVPGANIDIVCDVRHLPMIHNNSVEIVYASHILEYFDKDEAIKVLREWRRVLQVGGTLRLAVPDFESIANLYCAGWELTNFLGPIYGKMPVSNEKFIYHKTIYDFVLLEELLLKCGFRDIKHWSWKREFPDDYDDWSKSYLPHMDFAKGTLISLNVEGTKS